MQKRIVCLVLFGFLLTHQVGGLTSSERELGQSISSKLESVLRGNTGVLHGTAAGKRAGSVSYPSDGDFYQDIDCQLVLDSSKSIGRRKFQQAKRATKVVVDYIDNRSPISRRGTQIGLIEFSSPRKTHVEFKFGDYTSARAVKRAIDRVDYDKGSKTATALALELAQREINRNGRWENAKLVWLMSDGRANTGSPLRAARDLKDMGVTVCAIGVGKRVDMREIRAIASPGCAFKVSSFESYEKVMKYAASQGGAHGISDTRPPKRPSIDAGFFDGIQL